jgi:hypothetical protein
VRHRPNVVALAALFFLCAAAVAAHDGHVHKRLLGTVAAVSAEQLTITDRDGNDVEIALNARTRVLRGSTRVKLDEVKPGDRVAVGVSSDKAPYTAVEIRLGAAS